MNDMKCPCRTAKRMVSAVLKWTDYMEGYITLSEEEVEKTRQELISSIRPYRFNRELYENTKEKKQTDSSGDVGN